MRKRHIAVTAAAAAVLGIPAAGELGVDVKALDPVQQASADNSSSNSSSNSSKHVAKKKKNKKKRARR
jgi:rare lipoprotein A (peptidoglycan hydrolase)